MFKKGDIVLIKQIVRSVPEYTSDGEIKVLRKYSEHLQKTGIVLGHSSLKTGKLIKGDHYDGNYLEITKSHKVIVIEPLESYRPYSPNGEKLIKTNRYLEPVRCLESDIEHF